MFNRSLPCRTSIRSGGRSIFSADCGSKPTGRGASVVEASVITDSESARGGGQKTARSTNRSPPTAAGSRGATSATLRSMSPTTRANAAKAAAILISGDIRSALIVRLS
jgi:hypothetical protein